VRTYSGEDNTPASIIWNGKDDRGLPVGDGEYKLVMKVKDKSGRSIESGRETVKVSSSIPLQGGGVKLEE
jgi:flagellar hook assembly protein FlgD